MILSWILDHFRALRLDAWELFGLVGEGLFFARMLAQWGASEKARRPVLPVVYWHLSLAGAAIVAVYALHIKSLAVLLPQAAGLVFYARGLTLEFAHRARQRLRDAAGFDRPDFAWPALSVIVPARNEEKTLAATLDNLRAAASRYPGRTEIIAALNGCADNSPAIARAAPGVAVVESERSGISFGKNLGAAAAAGDLLVFVDADTTIPEDGLRRLAETLHGVARPAATVAGAPDRGGGVVRACFWLANRVCARNRLHAPGGVFALPRDVFRAIGGLDETLPQGTSTDVLRRAMAAGATYVYVDSFRATTSIRRFEKTGIVRQLLAWRRNHRDLERNRRDAVAARTYEDIR